MNKKFRINVVVVYSKGVEPIFYRSIILSFLENFAFMHYLDYVFEADSQTFPAESVSDSEILDLIFLRSSQKTRIERKQLQKAIELVLCHYNSFLEGVEVFCMLQKNLKDFPFPSEYYSTVQFPFVEGYKDGKKTVFVPRSVVHEIDDDSFDVILN